MNIAKMRKTRAQENKRINKMKTNFMESMARYEASASRINQITKNKLMSGEYRFVSKCGRSKIWDTFAKIVDENGLEMDKVVGCKKCFNIYTFHQSTSNLVKHRCYIMDNFKFKQSIEAQRKSAMPTKINIIPEMEVDSETKINICPRVDVDVETVKKGIHVITDWTVKNGRPFSIINDSGLKSLAEFFITVGAKYGQHVNMDKLLPHPTTISRNAKNLYDYHVDEVRNEILMYNHFGYSITSDIWTDNNLETSYLYLTVHYIKEAELVTRLLSVNSMNDVSCGDIKIKEIINKMLHEFGCNLERDNPTIVSDRTSSIILAFHGLNNIHCVNNLLHNVIERTINEVPELLKMINQCSKIVEYFRESGIDTNLEISLKSYCPTRWNTMYYLFKSIESNWITISNVLAEKNEIYRMEAIDLSNLSSVIILLARFESYSKKLEDTSFPTLHLVIPYINHLKKVCRIDINDVDIVKKCKGVLLDLIQTVVLQNLSKFHNIALFLFPPTNKLSQFTETEKEQTLVDCREIMKGFLNEDTTVKKEVISPSTPELDDIYADYCQPCKTNDVYDIINEEIQRYQNVNIAFSEDFNILQWWSSNMEEFPNLYKTSCKILATPASSAASERVFSTVKNLVSDQCYKIDANDDMLNRIMFLHSNIEEFNENVLDK